ncbi:hypothetical protein ABT168_04365 [Streptomyces sp. NPDC001793]|uniref:hypothetical protein n=1 Tax=Streptomyces sp. NPDC001793 TaxID=3154657 RepID=UPI00331A082B
MRKLQKTAVVAVVLGSFGFLGAGTSYAHGEKGGTGLDIKQGSQCRSHDMNVDVLGEVGIANGLGGNLLNGEGSAGAQNTTMGSSMGCNNTADFPKESKGGGDEDRGGGSEHRGSEARGPETRAPEARPVNEEKSSDAQQCGCSENKEGNQGGGQQQQQQQQQTAPQPHLNYTVRTESLTAS